MSVSVPAMVSVSEDGGPVHVCVTLSAGASVITDVPITTTLVTFDGK